MKGRKKFADGERFMVKESAPADFRERVGTIINHGPGKAEYTVRLDDDPSNLTYLQSNWMEPIVAAGSRDIEVSIRQGQ